MRALAVPALTFLLLAAPLGAQSAKSAPAKPAADTASARPAGAGCTAPSHAAASRELVALSGAESQVKQSSEAMIDMQLKTSPVLAEHFGDLLREYVSEQMQWKALEPEFVNLYCEMFTVPELRQMTEFNRTPLGQKIIRTMPELMRRAMAVGEARMQANMPAFQKKLEERMTKLRAEGKLPQ